MSPAACNSVYFGRWAGGFFLRFRLRRNCVAVLAGLALTACALPPAESVDLTRAPAPSSRTANVLLEDEQGPLTPERTAAALRQLDPEGENGLLAQHLRHVQESITEPVSLGNDARLLIDGPQTQREMLRAISQARSNIDLETYILEAEGMGERLAAILEAKRSKGVRARILYDGVGSLSTPDEFFDRLRSAGVEVCEFNPVTATRLKQDERLSINNRDHRKLLIVDNKVAFTGGINISAVYSSSSFSRQKKAPTRESGWRDTHVLVRGPVVGQFNGLFDAMWQQQGCDEAQAGVQNNAESGSGVDRTGPLPVAAASERTAPGGRKNGAWPPSARKVGERRARLAEKPERAGTMAIRLVAADPASQRSEQYIALLSAMEHARQRIWLTYGYFVPDKRVLQTLMDAARRGVDVRLMLPGFSDFWAPFHAGRSNYDDLLAAGVRLFERRDALLHAKTAVIDGVWSSVGSTNLDWRSFVHNYEADVLILDRRFAGELEKLFMMDEGAAHEVDAREWHERPVGTRLMEWFARRWAYYL
ncbi:phospholipase D-like domain-containing protein [Propionivibrio soli]|uniref:phospholipase D-like domain-containing protein n=1 Tax=Propionivibrio soli TaxID=2976531 RepID=UPI0021E7C728|nr:phospholipase D-like domain-containing protein [Propionivibrio soli]